MADEVPVGPLVINKVHLADLALTRRYGKGWRVTVGIPYLMAERSNPIRDASGDVFDRSVSAARGLGDVTVMGKKWLWDPKAKPKGNVSLGFGVKLPTGANNVTDTRKRFNTTTGTYTRTVQTVDQSIQPGDGGFGVLFDFQMYRLFSMNRFAAYASGLYLANPEGASDIETYRGPPEDVMSIADQYVARAGLAYYPGRGFGLSLGYRAEGVPVEDVIGGSDGFRRPGYAISYDPGVSWTRGAHSVAVQVAIAADRNRQRSVPDREDDDQGDAAFADWILLANYTRRF